MSKYQRPGQRDRVTIQEMLEAHATRREIGTAIGKSQSTVSRDLARNKKRGRCYEASRAHRVSKRRLVSMAVLPRLIRGPVERHIKKRLGQLHSPEQVANTLVVGSQASPSVTTIYLHVARDKDDGGKLYKSLRIRGKRPCRRRFKRGRPTIPSRVPIRLRPEIVNKRRRYGDWEADLVEGKNHSGYILTLCERKSRFVVLRVLRSKHAEGVANQIIKGLKNYKLCTITYDNGTEFSKHERVNEKFRCNYHISALRTTHGKRGRWKT